MTNIDAGEQFPSNAMGTSLNFDAASWTPALNFTAQFTDVAFAPLADAAPADLNEAAYRQEPTHATVI